MIVRLHYEGGIHEKEIKYTLDIYVLRWQLFIFLEGVGVIFVDGCFGMLRGRDPTAPRSRF